MIVVHHLNNSRSQRVLWLLEELGVPYQIRRYERDANTGNYKRGNERVASDHPRNRGRDER